MCRKFCGGLLMLALGSYLWFGPGVGSYTRTVLHSATEAIEKHKPIEFEIARADQLLREMDPEIDRTRRAIAEEEVRLENLQVEITTIGRHLEQEKLAVLALRGQLDKGLTSHEVDGQSFSRDELRNELHRRFSSYKGAADGLASRRELQESRRRALTAGQTKLNELLAARTELELRVADLEARAKMLDARKVANKFQRDDSSLANVRSALDRIDERLRVEDKLLDGAGATTRRVPVEKLAPADLSEQVDAYFGAHRKPAGASL